MGANDAREQLAVAIQEYNKLEAQLEAVRNLAVMAMENGYTISGEGLLRLITEAEGAEVDA